MKTWQWGLIIGLAALAAVVFLGLIGLAVYYRKHLFGDYSDKKLKVAIQNAYKETGKDPAELDILKIEEVQAEDASGQSIYDVRIKFLSGENSGKTLDFRYYFLMKKAEDGTKTLTVTNVVGAPANSPLGPMPETK